MLYVSFTECPSLLSPCTYKALSLPHWRLRGFKGQLVAHTHTQYLLYHIMLNRNTAAQHATHAIWQTLHKELHSCLTSCKALKASTQCGTQAWVGEMIAIVYLRRYHTLRIIQRNRQTPDRSQTSHTWREQKEYIRSCGVMRVMKCGKLVEWQYKLFVPYLPQF